MMVPGEAAEAADGLSAPDPGLIGSGRGAEGDAKTLRQKDRYRTKLRKA